MASVESLTSGSAAYKASSIPELEANLASQASEGAAAAVYNFDVIKTLAKLYKCFPAEEKADNYEVMLKLALQQYPDTSNFSALTCLIPQKHKQEGGSCSLMIQSAELLEAAKFEAFWEVYPTKGDNSVRSGILKVFANVYQNIDSAIVMKALNFQSTDELAAFVKTTGEATVDGSSVIFTLNQFNSEENTNCALSSANLQINSISQILQRPQ